MKNCINCKHYRPIEFFDCRSPANSIGADVYERSADNFRSAENGCGMDAKHHEMAKINVILENKVLEMFKK